MCYSCDFLGEDIHKSIDVDTRITQDNETNDNSSSANAANITVEELIMNDYDLHVRASHGGVIKYYIANSSDLAQDKDNSSTISLAGDILDPYDWMLDSIRELSAKVTDTFGVTLIETSNKDEANMHVVVRLSGDHIYQSTGLGGRHDWLTQTYERKVADDPYILVSLSQRWKYSIDEDTRVKTWISPWEESEYDNTAKIEFKGNYLHELGHALGLEHPWDKKRDNDWAVESSTDNHIPSIMGYGDDQKREWYSEIDIKALEYLWGKNGEIPPILSINPYSEKLSLIQI